MLALSCLSATTFDFSTDLKSKDPMAVIASLNTKGLNFGSSGSMFSKMLENDPTPAEFLSRASVQMLGSFAGSSIDMTGNHWKPDWQTKRHWLKLVLRVVIRKFKNGLDIRKFLDHSKAESFLTNVNEPCPWLDLWKTQLGRIAENISDEIAFIENILKDKDCSYLRLKLKVLQRDLDSVNAIIKYIDEHNNIADDRQDLICLFKHLIDNCLGNLADIEEYVRAIIRANVDPFPHNKEDNNVKAIGYGRRTCPYLRLKERLHWREAVNAADAFGFTYWLNHRGRRNREDCWRLKEAIRDAIHRIARAYGARRHRREDRDDRRHRRVRRQFRTEMF